MIPMVILFLFYTLFSLELRHSIAQTWIRAGYLRCSENQFPIPDESSALFTHSICGFAGVNSSTYQLSLSPPEEKKLSTFADTVKQKNPSITTLISIGGRGVNDSTFSSMASNPSYRKSFIDSSIKIARLYGFQGLDLSWQYPKTSSDMFNMGVLFEEWQAAIRLEARNSSHSQLILTARVYYSPLTPSESTYPIDSIKKYLNWVHVVTADYSSPGKKNFTSAHAALYDPSTVLNTDYGIRGWIEAGLSTNKLVLCLPFYGYAWTLIKPEDNGIGAPAKGPAINTESGGGITYKQIKKQIDRYGPNVHVMYNATYVLNYCTIGTSWIGFDDVEAVTAKVSYAMEEKLLGYFVLHVSYDINWTLSQAAAEVNINNSSDQKDNKNEKGWSHLLVIVLTTTAAVVLLLAVIVIYYCWRKKLGIKAKRSKDEENKPAADGDFSSSVPNLIEYTLADIEAATNGFSVDNKLGQGGYGPVYKGTLQDGQEIAVKKLSKRSAQGFEEFKNEVILTAKLQHVNLVRVLGYCIDREDHMLIYEYMKNKSLDYYLFDPNRQYILDWIKRVHIIEGVTQGLLYLQEYSRFTIIHRDLKASNILLDEDMKPKISDFGMARIFVKYYLEANTEKIVGTIGYVPPEYLRMGIYSMKSDVYSFGVLLLEIISEKSIVCNLKLLEYAYELWKAGKAMELMDPSLDDTCSSCKMTRCLQIALLCIQENPNDRPSMLEVFTMIKNENKDMMIPNKPAFSRQHDGNQRNEAIMKLEICPASTSMNDVTFSEE